jgi:hypothetical protein
MKIEIELEDVEYLKRQLREAQEERDELKKEIEKLSPDALKREALQLSYRLFNDYMTAVFEELGFDQWKKNSVIYPPNLVSWYGEEWWRNDRIKFEFGAEVTTEFRSAFIRINVLPKKED